jgi:hypothetical protein
LPARARSNALILEVTKMEDQLGDQITEKEAKKKADSGT